MQVLNGSVELANGIARAASHLSRLRERGGMFRPMIRALAFFLLATPAWAVDVPSGQPVDLHEVLIDDIDGTPVLRFRFLAPDIARARAKMTYMDSVDDIAHLCANVALPYIDDFELEGDVIVISLADRAVEFGQASPDATQFFDAFRVQDNTCIWEEF